HQERDDTRIGHRIPPRLDRRAVAAVLLEDDQLDLVSEAPCYFNRAIGGPVAHDGDVDTRDGRRFEDDRSRHERAPDGRADALLFVERWDDYAETHQRRYVSVAGTTAKLVAYADPAHRPRIARSGEHECSHPLSN